MYKSRNIHFLIAKNHTQHNTTQHKSSKIFAISSTINLKKWFKYLIMNYLISTLYSIVLLFALGTSATAQFPSHINKVDVKTGQSKTVKGNLTTGRSVDLRFGMRGSVGCYSDSEKYLFSGHHVFYTFEVPANTKVLVELSDQDSDMSLYAYMMSKDRYDVPPYLENVGKTGCANSHNPKDQTNRVMLKAGSSTMNVVVGVAGANEAAGGDFNIKITTKS
jgi:hypothetical protein